MCRKKWFFCSVVLSLLTSITVPAIAAKEASLFEMMDRLDKFDKQDFQAAIDKANACTRSRNFLCSASELEKAAKAANSGQDKKTLLASQNSLANEKQQLANELMRAEEERQAQVRREQQEKEAQVRRDEEREARIWREQQQAREAEDRQSTRDYNAAIGAQIRQSVADNAALLKKVDRQTDAAIRDSNRVLAAQAAERDRARAEREDRETDRRRDAERDRASRAARADAERQQTQQAEQDRAREQEVNRKKLAEIAETRAAEQEKARTQELSRQMRNKEKADKLAAEQTKRTAEEQAGKAYLASLVQGIRLVATKCPDGEGHYYATGNMPKVKHEAVSCIDVYYEASCPGSRQTVTGVAKNFIGMSGCFGDTYQVEPKPACAVKDVRIQVTDVRPGCK